MRGTAAPGPAPAPGRKPDLRELVTVYGKIGILGFGGGYAVLAFIRAEVVTSRAWMTDEQFDHIVEMTAFAPGATTINVMAAIAYRLLGPAGVAVGALAVLWPSFLVILALAAATAVMRQPWLVGALRGVEVAVVGLLATVVATLGKDLPRHMLLYAIAAGAFVLTLAGLDPVWTVLLAAAAGALDFLVRRRPFPNPGAGRSSPGDTTSAPKP